jgi:hypothetical protein
MADAGVDEGAVQEPPSPKSTSSTDDEPEPGPELESAANPEPEPEEEDAKEADDSHENTPELKRLFDSIDIDGGGTLDRDEVAELAVKMGIFMTDAQLDESMAQVRDARNCHLRTRVRSSLLHNYRQLAVANEVLSPAHNRADGHHRLGRRVLCRV